MNSADYQALYERTLAHLQSKKRILFLTTSNRYTGWVTSDIPKSTQLAHKLAATLWERVEIIDVTKLNIEPCSGNVSSSQWNICWLKAATLEDQEKNPSGYHRCWVNHSNHEDELRKISKSLLAADAVVFFTSVRRWQTNSFYQKVIERLTWLENRHSTLGEDNVLQNIDAWIIITGHNRNADQVLNTQKEVLRYYGFNLAESLCRDRYHTLVATDETKEGYKKAAEVFKETFFNV